jgi:hypothetical protein
LDDTTRVVLGLLAPPVAEVVSAHGERVELRVQLDDQVMPGIYPLRLATSAGLSNPVTIAVDRLPLCEFGEPLITPPVALYGTIRGSDVLQTTFSGRAGQRIVIDVDAQRVGSKLRPSLRLYSPERRLLGVALPSKRIGGDARLDVRLPGDGVYRVELQDVVYKAADSSWFRLKIGDLKYADSVFPLAVAAGTPAKIQLVSTNITEEARVWPSMPAWATEQQINWPGISEMPFTGAVPRVRLSWLGSDEWSEADAKAQSALLHVPAAINGRLTENGEQDEYHVQVSAGAKLRIEVQADRWGSPLDAVLVVVSANGTALARADDQPDSTDPALELDVPADASPLTLRISSLVGRGSDESVYRLLIGPVEPARPSLTADVDRLNVAAGARVVVPLKVDHHGQPRELQLSLPPAIADVVTISPNRLAATDELGLVAFEAAATARGVFNVVLMAHTLDAPGSEPVCVHTGSFPGTDYQPQLRRELPIAVGEPAPIELAWSDATGPEYLAPGTSRPLTVQIRRRSGGEGPVRLSLVSSQVPPLKKVDNREVADEERTLRLLERTIIGADQSTGEVTLVTPVDLPLHPWSLALTGELLSADGQQVLATAFTPIRRWPAVAPLQLALVGDARRAVKAGDEAGLVLRGQVLRHPDFVFPVQIRLQGLAETDPQPTVTLPADQTDFELKLSFVKQSPVREIKEVRLLATPAQPSDANRAISVQSAAVAIQVTAPDK